MLKSVDFAKTFRGASVLRGSEPFVAEITRDEEAVHAQWLDPDRKQLFPTAVRKMVDWLPHFNVEDATLLDSNSLGRSSICPDPAGSLLCRSGEPERAARLARASAWSEISLV
jgi:hypothetical protein